MKKLAHEDLDNLAIGSAILGSGGGGDPAYDRWMAQHAMEQFGAVTLIGKDELPEDALVIPIAFIGAPLVGVEKIPSGREISHLLSAIQKLRPSASLVLLPAEIGGGNAYAPFSIASQMDLPVLDGDTLGRAFPELQMSACHLGGVSSSPAILADSLGNTAVIEAIDSYQLEHLARSLAVAMGSYCALAFYLMTAGQARSTIVHGTLSKAMQMGAAFKQAQKNGNDPIEAILKEHQGKRLAQGKIIDVNQTVQNGFLTGSATIQDSPSVWTVIYQNEYLFVRCAEKIVASTPDIFILFDQETGQPLTSESLQYGLQVVLAALPAPSIWQTAEGLALAGPQAFGYSHSYNPITQKENP